MCRTSRTVNRLGLTRHVSDRCRTDTSTFLEGRGSSKRLRSSTETVRSTSRLTDLQNRPVRGATFSHCSRPAGRIAWYRNGSQVRFLLPPPR